MLQVAAARVVVRTDWYEQARCQESSPRVCVKVRPYIAVMAIANFAFDAMRSLRKVNARCPSCGGGGQHWSTNRHLSGPVDGCCQLLTGFLPVEMLLTCCPLPPAGCQGMQATSNILFCKPAWSRFGPNAWCWPQTTKQVTGSQQALGFSIQSIYNAVAL
jgi:hypothetical protein